MTETTQPLDMPLSGLRLVEASAGTGKTFTLAGLYLRLLIERRLAVRDILVMTFTRAATQELRERIRARLARAAELAQDPTLSNADKPEDAITVRLLQASDEDARTLARRLSDAAARMDEATITTIHGFSQMAVAENAFESGIAFDRGEQAEDAPLLEEAVNDFWRRQVIGGENPALGRLWPTPAACLKALRPVLKKPGIGVAGPDRAQIHDSVDRAKKAWAQQRPALEASIAKVAEAGDFHSGRVLAKVIGPADRVKTVFEELDEAVASGPVSHPVLEALSSEKILNQIKGASKKAGIPAEQTEAVDQLLAVIPLLQLARVTEAASAVKAGLDRIKRERRLFSFDDMIQALHAAITDPDKGPALAAALKKRWPWAMVDEFQDTDPTQYAILKAIYAGEPASNSSGLIMIGDPKQAIYAFRGGDVFAYLQAAKDAEGRYSLAHNFRSSDGLLSAVETVFRGPQNPFVIDRIDFQSVEAGRPDNDWWIERDGQPLPPMSLWTLDAEPGQDPINKQAAHQQLRRQCIADIAHLLNDGQVHKNGTTRPVRAQDICVLVNTNRQAVALQAALSRHGIPAACLHQDAVFASDQALELLRLLRAAATPADARRVKAALTGELFGWCLGQLIELARDEGLWQRCYDRFQAAHQRWEDNGVLAMLEPLIQDASAGLLSRLDGERRMTNWLHLAELAQAAEVESFGMNGLIRWLAERIRESEDGNGDAGEAAQLRLESDENLVRITTIYKAKGLQWPVVMLPFLPELGTTGAKHHKPGKAPFEFHDQQDQARLELRDPPPEANASQAIRERKAEGLRLLYVALTRAEQALYMASGPIKDCHNGALSWLLLHAAGCPDKAWPTAKEAEGFFNAQTLRQAHQALLEKGEPHIQAVPVSWQAVPPGRLDSAPPPSGEARSDFPERRPVWQMLSFSALVRDDRHGTATRSGADDEATDLDKPQDATGRGPGSRPVDSPTDPALDHLAGPGFGSAVHDVLEETIVRQWPTTDNAIHPEQADAIEKQLRRHGLVFDNHRQLEQAVAAIGRMITRSLRTPLPEIGPLASLEREQCLAEMPFTLRLRGQTASRIIQCLEQHGYHSALSASHRGQVLNGLMQGFIDLIVERDGRYWVIDYKTNRLGDFLEDYAPGPLQQAVRDGHYDLQYLIYMTALHRHLQLSLPGYDPNQHLGGVQYLFLRGMNGKNADTGIHEDRPNSELILSLDRLFDGEAIPS